MGEAWRALDKKAQESLMKRMLSAAHQGNVGEVEKALKENCDVDVMDVSSPNAAGETALHYAVAENKKQVVKLLIEYNATLAIKVKMGEWGLTPLHYAARKGYADIAELVYDPKAAASSDNYLKKTPKELAKKEGRDDIVDLLKQLDKQSRK